MIAAGCSSAPRAAPTPPPLPLSRTADFGLAITVYAPDASPGRPRSLRAARYLIEADGALRARFATPGEVAERVFPPIVRPLTPTELDQLWALVRQTGLDDSAATTESVVIDPATIAALKAGETAALLRLAQSNTARTWRIPLDRQSDTALATERLIDRLAEWSRVSATGR